MNFYDDGTPVGLGLVKVASFGALAGAAMKGASKLGMLTAKGVGKAGKLIQRGGAALGNGKLGGAIGGVMQNTGKYMRGTQNWVRQGNNAAKLGGAVAGTLAAGGGLLAAARGLSKTTVPEEAGAQNYSGPGMI